MSLIFSIDPGQANSAYLLFDPDATTYPLVALEYGIVANLTLRDKMRSSSVLNAASICVIEKIEHYGMPAGESLFTTCVWIGRFIEAWSRDPSVLMPRREVKQHLCHSPKATDATIRAALMDLYSRAGHQDAIGKKKTPGPLYGISKDVWSCLALAATYAAHGTEGPCLACGWGLQSPTIDRPASTRLLSC